MTDDQAVQQLADRTAAYTDPPLSGPQLLGILQDRRRARAFVASAAYRTGEIVLAAGADPAQPGTAYVVLVGGVAGASAPSVWPQDARTPVTSGQVQFRLYGPYDGVPYNLDSAEREVYLRKAAMVALRIDLMTGPDRAALSQQYDHFMGLAKQAAPEWPL